MIQVKEINGTIQAFDATGYRVATPEEETAVRARWSRAANLREIALIKKQLAETDYQCLKFADGALSEEEYAPVRAYRQTLRDRINELETL